jgi:hypothetical protein
MLKVVTSDSGTVVVDTVQSGVHAVTIPKGFRVLGGREWVTAGDQWYLAGSPGHGYFCDATQEHLSNNCRARDIVGTIFIRRDNG